MILRRCLKCNIETDERGDMHCRKKFVNELQELVESERLEEAEALVDRNSGYGEWWQQQEDILDEMLKSKIDNWPELKIRRNEKAKSRKERLAEDNHRELLSSLGIVYAGVSQSTARKAHRTSSCFRCKKALDSEIDAQCKSCNWMICICGACGCVYEKY